MDAVSTTGAKSVEVVTARDNRTSVKGVYYGSPGCERQTFTLVLPSPKGRDVDHITRQAARASMWALFVCRGVRRRDMTKAQCDWTQPVDHIIGGKPLVSKPPRKPTKADVRRLREAVIPKSKETPAERGARLQAERAHHADVMLTKARRRIGKLESDLKRAHTVEARWLAKVRYYARQNVKHIEAALADVSDLDEVDAALDGALDAVKGRSDD
jgi:hypothetical protein